MRRLWFFGQRFLLDYPQCQLRLARFRGLDKTEFNDQRQVNGHALQLMSEAMDFLSCHWIEPGVSERMDEPLFPPVALREALVNAFCHQDYSHGGARSALPFMMTGWRCGVTVLCHSGCA